MKILETRIPGWFINLKTKKFNKNLLTIFIYLYCKWLKIILLSSFNQQNNLSCAFFSYVLNNYIYIKVTISFILYYTTIMNISKRRIIDWLTDTANYRIFSLKKWIIKDNCEVKHICHIENFKFIVKALHCPPTTMRGK